MWQAVTPLFWTKWQEIKPRGLSKEKSDALIKAVQYLKTTWFEDKTVRHWYQGALPLGPMTNNNLERNNGILKSKEYANHTKLGFQELFDLVSSQIGR